MRPGVRPALETIGGKRRQVNGLGRVKQKERLVGAGLDVLFEELLAFVQEHQVHLFQIEIRRDHTGATIPGIGMLRQCS